MKNSGYIVSEWVEHAAGEFESAFDNFTRALEFTDKRQPVSYLYETVPGTGMTPPEIFDLVNKALDAFFQVERDEDGNIIEDDY